MVITSDIVRRERDPYLVTQETRDRSGLSLTATESVLLNITVALVLIKFPQIISHLVAQTTETEK